MRRKRRLWKYFGDLKPSFLCFYSLPSCRQISETLPAHLSEVHRPHFIPPFRTPNPHFSGFDFFVNNTILRKFKTWIHDIMSTFSFIICLLASLQLTHLLYSTTVLHTYCTSKSTLFNAWCLSTPPHQKTTTPIFYIESTKHINISQRAPPRKKQTCSFWVF